MGHWMSLCFYPLFTHPVSGTVPGIVPRHTMRPNYKSLTQATRFLFHPNLNLSHSCLRRRLQNFQGSLCETPPTRKAIYMSGSVMAQARNDHAVANSPLFSLPPEIRNAIYKACLRRYIIGVASSVEEDGIFVCAEQGHYTPPAASSLLATTLSYCRYPSRMLPRLLNPVDQQAGLVKPGSFTQVAEISLLRVCRKVREEVASLLPRSTCCVRRSSSFAYHQAWGSIASALAPSKYPDQNPTCPVQ